MSNLPATSRKHMEVKIAANKHRFDFISLIRILAYIGYKPEQILFKSYNSLCSQNSLIHDIDFIKTPVISVIITVNFGLLSAQTPLPSYFQKHIDKRMVDVQTFYQFIGFFDNPVIMNFLHSVYPELNRKLFRNWEGMKNTYTMMLDLKSTTTLHWLFSLVFPDLGVKIDKCSYKRIVTTTPFVLGKATLGDSAAFGDKTSVTVNGRKVTFFCDNELTANNDPWPVEIKKRLNDIVFPILRSVGVDLQIYLVIKSQTQWAKLQQSSYLGYDKIRGGKESLKQIRIFKGYLLN